MSRADRHNLRRLRRCSAEMNRMISDGSFEDLAPERQTRIVSRLRRLCEDLVGVVSEAALRSILAGAAVIVLGIAGCGGGGGGETDTHTDPDVDVVEITDVPAETDVPDLADVVDTVEEDVAEIEDTPEEDAIDVVDAPDTVDAPDVVDVVDAPDVIEVVDATDPDTDPTGVTPSFAAPVADPFGIALPTTSYYMLPAFADIDGDGDLDLFAGEVDLYGGTMYFLRNTGTPTSPAFAAPTSNPFGITGVGPIPAASFGDLDDDGDPDFVLSYTDVLGMRANVLYYQNTGSATSPAFASPVTNPFGIAAITSGPAALPALADMDGDADMDLFAGLYAGEMYYYQNTGSVTAPAFAAPVLDPFGFTARREIAVPAVTDLDLDGDRDLLVGEYYANLTYFQNTGSATAPAFASPSTNPFGLTAASSDYAFPAFADIDADGDADLFVAEGGGAIQFFENTTY